MPPDEALAAIASETLPTEGRLPGEHRLADSRAELETLLGSRETNGFPRSHTMRFLLGRGGGTIALATLAGLLAVNPRLATTIIRILPLGRLARRLL